MVRRIPKRYVAGSDVPSSRPGRPPMPPRHKSGIIERGGERPQNPPEPPTTQSHVPEAPERSIGANLESGGHLSETKTPAPPAGTVGVYLSDIKTDKRALLGYFAPNDLVDVEGVLLAKGINGKDGAHIYAATFFVNDAVAGFEIIYEPE